MEFCLDHSMEFHLDRLTEFRLDALMDCSTEFHDNQLERAVIERGWLNESVMPVRNHLEYTARMIFIVVFLWGKTMNSYRWNKG